MKKLLFVLMLCVAVLPLNADIFDDIENGNQQAVSSFLASGGDPNTRQADGLHYPLIVWASKDWNRINAIQGKTEQHNYAPIVKMLINAGADVNAQTIDNITKDTAILEASKGLETKDRIEIVKLLLKAGADQAKNEHSYPIYWASYYNCPETLKLLIAAGGNVNDGRTNSQTPVITAAFNGNTAILEILAKNGADLYKKDALGWVIASYLNRTNPKILSSIKTLIKLGVDVNAPDKYNEYKKTQLMRVAQGGEEISEEEKRLCGNDCRHAATPGTKELEEITKIIWDAGASKSINAVDSDGWTALMYASEYGNLDMVNRLLAANAKVNMVNKGGGTALMIASNNGKNDIVKLLIAKGANVNAIDINGTTALMYAAMNGDTDIVKNLLAAGANINTQDTYGWTALMFACRDVKEDTELIQTLIDSGANIALRTKEKDNKSDALMIASAYGNLNAVKTLIAAGANINTKDKNDWSAMHWASGMGHKEVVDALLAAGAKKDLYDKESNILVSLIASGQTDRVKTFIQGGANVNAETKDSWTALRTAARFGHADTIDLLLDYGADINAASKEGWTALMLAAGSNHVDVVKALLAVPTINLNAKLKANGKTALNLAEIQGNTEIIKLLKNAGAK